MTSKELSISEKEGGGGHESKRFYAIVIVSLFCALLIGGGLAIGLAIGLRGMYLSGCSSETVKPPSITCPLPQTTVTPTVTSETSQSKVGRYRFASVAADAQVCSQIGTDILAFDKGSAVDAAIAAMLCIGVVNLHSAGIGGGSFAVVYSNNKSRPIEDRAKWFNFREVAPLAANETMFVNGSASSTDGGMAMGVPGEIKGYYEMHKQFGKLPWKQLFQPAIKLATNGFTVGSSLAIAIKSKWKRSAPYTIFRDLISNNAGEPLKTGDLIKRPKLAKTLTTISDDPEAFYTGQLSQDIVDDLQEQGSIITLEDLQKYAVSMKEPLISNVDKYTVISGPPPSSGALIHHMLHILKGYNMKPADIGNDSSSILTYHRIIEAMKYAFAKRSHFGDADFVTDLDPLVRNMTSIEYGEYIRSLINDDKTYLPEHYGAKFVKDEVQGTSHLSILDADGNAVALTSTINLYFGSMVRGNRTGILFNNEMDDFSTPGLINAFGVPPSESNFIKPQKRPQSSMSPTVVTDEEGDVQLVIGGSGGTRIITGTFTVLYRLLFLGQSLSEAMDSPRLHHQLVPNYIRYDTSPSEVIKNGLKAKGHTFNTRRAVSSCQAVQKDGKYIYGVADFRKYSQADGY